MAARYKPVCASPVNDSDGAAAEPLPNVKALMNDEVEVCALYTFVPSQIAMIVWFWGSVIVRPPMVPVENVNEYAPVVLFLNEYNCTVGGTITVQFEVKTPWYS